MFWLMAISSQELPPGVVSKQLQDASKGMAQMADEMQQFHVVAEHAATAFDPFVGTTQGFGSGSSYRPHSQSMVPRSQHHPGNALPPSLVPPPDVPVPADVPPPAPPPAAPELLSETT